MFPQGWLWTSLILLGIISHLSSQLLDIFLGVVQGHLGDILDALGGKGFWDPCAVVHLKASLHFPSMWTLWKHPGDVPKQNKTITESTKSNRSVPMLAWNKNSEDELVLEEKREERIEGGRGVLEDFGTSPRSPIITTR